MSTNPLQVVIDEVATMKAEDINVFGIAAMILAKFASTTKRIAWKELVKAHNSSCLPALVVSEYSDGRDGMNVRNEFFEMEHDSENPLHKVATWKKDVNEVAHASDGVKRGTLVGIKLSKKVNSRKLAKFYRKS